MSIFIFKQNTSSYIDFCYIVVCCHRRWLTLQALGGAPGRLHEQQPRHAQSQEDRLVLFSKVLVQQTIDDGVEAAVKVCHEVAGDKQPLRDARCNPAGIYRHCQAYEVQRCPAYSE